MHPLAESLLPIHYPDSDGQAMADNTPQFRWIETLVDGLQHSFADDPEVFVAGDLLGYPVEGDHKTRIAPDALVAFGRPKGEGDSYKQSEEGSIPPQVVFEVLSPGNTAEEMQRKRAFYERYRVEEYYVYDPDLGKLQGWRRQRGGLRPIPAMRGWESPRRRGRFDLNGKDLRRGGPDGRGFESYLEVALRADAPERHAANEAQARVAAAPRASDAERRAEAEAQARAAPRSRTGAASGIVVELLTRGPIH